MAKKVTKLPSLTEEEQQVVNMLRQAFKSHNERDTMLSPQQLLKVFAEYEANTAEEWSDAVFDYEVEQGLTEREEEEEKTAIPSTSSASDRVSPELVTKLNGDTALRSLLREGGELDIRKKTLPLETMDRLIATFGSDVVYRTFADPDTVANNKDFDHGIVSNNPDLKKVPGDNNRKRNESWFDVFYSQSEDGIKLKAQEATLKAEEKDAKAKGTDVTGIQADLKVIRKRFRAGVVLLKTATAIHKQMVRMQEHSDQVALDPYKDSEGKWKRTLDAFTLQDKSPGKSRNLRILSISALVNMDIDGAWKAAQADKSKTFYEHLIEGLNRGAGDGEPSTGMKVDDKKALDVLIGLGLYLEGNGADYIIAQMVQNKNIGVSREYEAHITRLYKQVDALQAMVDARRAKRKEQAELAAKMKQNAAAGQQ